MAKEVEIKFALADKAAVERKLRRMGFRRVTPETFEFNTIYDLPGNILRHRGELLRLRRFGDLWTLTHKARAVSGTRHKSRIEREIRVPDGPTLASILEALGFSPIFRYEKFRTEWTDGRGHVVLDRTPIGEYGEIEGAPRWIDRTARQLEVPASAYITSSYGELFTQWKTLTRSPAMEMTFRALSSQARRKRS